MATTLVNIDPRSQSQPALARAIDYAKTTDSKLQLHSAAYVDNTDKEQSNYQFIRSALIHEYELRLNKYVKAARKIGISTNYTLSWSKDSYTSANTEATRSHCDIIFKEWTSRHSLKNFLLDRKAIHMITESPCSIGIIKNKRPWRNKRVIISINPDYYQGNQQKDLRRELDCAREVGRRNFEVYFFIPYRDSLHYPDRHQLINLCHSSNDHIITRGGKESSAIAECAAELSADLLITTIPGTDEKNRRLQEHHFRRIIEESPCDILALH